MKKEALRHPKTFDLASRLGIDVPCAIGYLALLIDFVEDNAIRGDLGKWPDGAIARACQWRGDPAAFVQALVDAGWINTHPDHRLVLHDWHQHAPNWVVAKLTRSKTWFVSDLSGDLSGDLRAHYEPNRTEPIVDVDVDEGTSDVDAIDSAAIAWDQVRKHCQQLARKVSIKTMGDRSLLLKAAALAVAHPKLSQAWIEDAVEAVSRKRGIKKPGAMLHTILKAKSAELGLNFNAMLAKIQVPGDVMQPGSTVGQQKPAEQSQIILRDALARRKA